jgi:DNA-binding GntR family transcriptional regulator
MPGSIHPKPLSRPETFKDAAHQQIKKLLSAGRLEEDTYYSAIGFAEMLGVSRTPVREALLQLSAEGFLTAVDGRGFKVRRLTVKEVRDFFETRRIVELYVVEKIAPAISDSALAALRKLLDRMSAAAAVRDGVEFLDADKAFHLRLIHLHGNLHLQSIMDNVRDLISLHGRHAIGEAGRFESVVAEHTAVCKALAGRDPVRAVAAMRAHLDTTEAILAEQVQRAVSSAPSPS